MNTKSETNLPILERSDEMRCAHTQTEPLGWNRDVLFLRCQSCGGALVQQGNQTLFVPRASQP